MTEKIYDKMQLGRESTAGTGVAATTVFPIDEGFLGFELDRATESPDEDYGSSSREQPGRESHGIRLANATLPFVMRFQDLMHPLEMHVKGSVSPTGSGPYVYVYTFDETSMTLKPYTMEYGDINSTQDEWRGVGCIATGLELGFDALSAPGNAMWKGSLDLLALDREAAAMTSAQTPPATLETMEGHYTTLAYGSTSTAFGSLTALTASLKSFRLTSAINAQARAYGGTTDIASVWGRSGKGEINFEAMLKLTSTTKTNMLDVFNVSGSVASEQRWRVAIDGSGNNVATIDARVRYRAVDVGEHEGERLYLCKGVMVNDATLGGRCAITLTNDVASVP